MPSASTRRVGRGERGQIMILGALGVLLVALMMLLTLNVGQSVFEKIRIQQFQAALQISACPPCCGDVSLFFGGILAEAFDSGGGSRRIRIASSSGCLCLGHVACFHLSHLIISILSNTYHLRLRCRH